MKTIQDRLDELLQNVGDMALKIRAKMVIQQLELKNGDKVLDLGCGSGYYSYLLSKMPIKLNITGIDNHVNAIEDAKRDVGEKNAKFIIGNAEKLPFPENSFDKIVMSEIIEHVKDDIRVLKEARRVLKQGGILVLTTPNKNYPFLWDPVNWILEHFFNFHVKSGFFAGIWNQHLRLYKPEVIEKKLGKLDFKIISSKLLTSWCLPFNHYLLNLGCKLLFYKKLSPDLLQDINKFSESKNKKTYLSNLLFWLVNTFDKLNDIFPNSSGVSIFIKAVKK
ncbi:MAG: methyltransferase domain-containing protein [Candidatus Daviesbacteria bacterium]|nr:methyltransferase domain-containing protein [Candidatus Daviesbacteria bacterium]